MKKIFFLILSLLSTPAFAQGPDDMSRRNENAVTEIGKDYGAVQRKMDDAFREFDAMDKNGDGMVSEAEYKSYYESLYGAGAKEEENDGKQ